MTAESSVLPPLSGTRILTSWRLDVPATIVVVLLAASYVLGVWRLRARGESWGGRRVWAFLLLGIGSIVVVTMSAIGVYSRVLFWPRAVQNTALLGVSPLFLAMGEPVELLRRGLQPSTRARLDATLRSGPVRVLAFPGTGALLGVAALLALYLSPLYRLTLTDRTAEHLTQVVLLLLGIAFFVPEFDQGDTLLPKWCGYSVRAAFSVVDGLLDAVPGVVIMTMHGTIAASYYAGLHRTWGPSLHWDQTIGGGLMFTIAEVVALPFLVVLFIRWSHEDEQIGHEIDRQLEAAARADAPPGGDDTPQATRPWWETDSGLMAQRAYPARSRRGHKPQ